tara:strand:- start:461 stop:925 length:465 start_codon:yes stop_codon:yes gene_type:complete
MNEPRERIPASDDYLKALGRATYNFAYLEWGIIWLTETLERGFLSKVSKLTAGKIANNFEIIARSIGDYDPQKTEIVSLSVDFKKFVKERNKLMHGNPFTAEDGEQRLLYNGRLGRRDWEVALIEDFADEAALLSIKAGKILHSGRYKTWLKNG